MIPAKNERIVQNMSAKNPRKTNFFARSIEYTFAMISVVMKINGRVNTASEIWVPKKKGNVFIPRRLLANIAVI
jgi:hypothetical protein